MSDFVEVKTDKKTKGKIHSELNNYSNKFYWNIQFNIPLQMNTINSDTTNVTNEYGDILKAKVFYVPYEKVIVIEPQDNYADDTYYFLNISKGVCSENGTSLKNEVHIRFKLKNKKIVEVKSFKGEVKFKTIPLSLRLNLPYFRISSKYSNKPLAYDFKMPYLIMPYFLLPIILCFFVFLYMPRHLDYIICFPICIVLTLMQLVIIVIQYRGKRKKAISMYNQGVTHYNSRELLDALDCFKLAYDIDSTNQTIKNAIIKVNRYLN